MQLMKCNETGKIMCPKLRKDVSKLLDVMHKLSSSLSRELDRRTLETL